MTNGPDTTKMRKAGSLVRFWQDGAEVRFDYGGPVLAITLYAEGIARVRFTPTGAFAPPRSWTQVRPQEQLTTTAPAIAAREDTVDLEAGELRVQVAREGARVTVREQGGRVVVADGPRGGPRWQPEGGAAWVKAMPPDTHYYGFGSRTGLLDKRGRRYSCWTTDRYEEQGPGTDTLYTAIPVMLALDSAGRSYGLLLNTTSRSAFDLSAIQDQTLRLETDDDQVDYFVISGPGVGRVVERLSSLTGRMPLPPRWAMGYHQGRWSYASADELCAVAAEFRRWRIPADALHLDIDSMDGFRVFTWDRSRFPDPAGMNTGLAQRGFRVVTLVDVGVKHEPEATDGVFAEGSRHNMFLRIDRSPTAPLFLGYVWPGLCAFPDFARAEVREWWGRQYAALLADGVAGFVNDMNEPAMHDRPYDDPRGFRTDPPLDLPHGAADEPATHAEVHNVYGTLEAEATYAGLRAARPDERPFLITRAAAAGIQRYAAVWTGDNASYWEHLEMSLPQLLNLGLSGVPLAGADIGGFFADCGPELLARWFQLGAFYPLARGNAAKGCARQEPWAWGEPTLAICRRALQLRYRLLPYLYTLVAEAAKTGAPVLRPLLYHYGDDPATHQLHDQALLGTDLLIAPVLRPGKTAREVYLPRGIWYDLRTDERYRGPRHILASAALEELPPCYARGGAIIPCGPPLQWSDERPLDPLTLLVFPDTHGAAAGTLYEDDGHSFAYAQGEACTTHFRLGRDADGTMQLAARREGGFVPPPRVVEVELYGSARRRLTRHERDEQAWSMEVSL